MAEIITKINRLLVDIEVNDGEQRTMAFDVDQTKLDEATFERKSNNSGTQITISIPCKSMVVCDKAYSDSKSTIDKEYDDYE